MDPSAQVLGALPEPLRNELLSAFREITTNYRQSRWEPSELNGGKLCEVVYSIIRGCADGSYPAKASKPPNMVDACRALEHEKQLPRSLAVQIPRMLIGLYEIRNNRGVGHVGGDVNPNHMDSVAVLYASKWIVAELVRVFHQLDVDTATAVVDGLIDRELPVVWRVGVNRRVLAKGLTLKQQMMLLLYGNPSATPERDLLSWLEKSRAAATFRRDVLRPAHKERLVEYDDVTKTVLLSPLGVEYVETNLPLTVNGAAQSLKDWSERHG
jgi:hypothetical protein